MDEFEELIDILVEKIELSDDRYTLVINRKYQLVVDAGCCSETWIEHIIGVKQLLRSKIRSVERLEFPSAYVEYLTKAEPSADYTQYYGLAISSNNGQMIIDFRNRSNGYYGGSIQLLISEKIPPNLRLITEDE